MKKTKATKPARLAKAGKTVAKKQREAAPKEPTTDSLPPLDPAGLDAPEIGASLRTLRAQRGLSLDKLAHLAGVSRAMLGQIELGQSVPTIKTVWRIARALEVPFSRLLGPEPSSATVILPAGKARLLQSADGAFTSRALFPFGSPRKVEFYELRLRGRSTENAEAHAAGTMENLVVATGKVEIQVPDQNFALGTGDAIVFAADLPHAYVNKHDKDAVLYLVMTYAEPNI